MTLADYENFYQLLYQGSNVILYAAIVIELMLFFILKKNFYEFKSFLCDMGFVFARVIFFALTFQYLETTLDLAYQYRIIDWSIGYIARFLALFILIDFTLYWAHRWMHQNRFLWTIHSAHHSVENLNIISSYRFNFFNIFYDSVIYCFFALLGFNPKEILVIVFFMLTWQSICHTQFKVNLGFLEKMIITPSNHRVHHGTNECYLDKNYANFLIIWDRIFKTYQLEVEPVKYGLLHPVKTYNPFKLMFVPMKNFFGKNNSSLT